MDIEDQYEEQRPFFWFTFNDFNSTKSLIIEKKCLFEQKLFQIDSNNVEQSIDYDRFLNSISFDQWKEFQANYDFMRNYGFNDKKDFIFKLDFIHQSKQIETWMMNFHRGNIFRRNVGIKQSEIQNSNSLWQDSIQFQYYNITGVVKVVVEQKFKIQIEVESEILNTLFNLQLEVTAKLLENDEETYTLYPKALEEKQKYEIHHNITKGIYQVDIKLLFQLKQGIHEIFVPQTTYQQVESLRLNVSDPPSLLFPSKAEIVNRIAQINEGEEDSSILNINNIIIITCVGIVATVIYSIYDAFNLKKLVEAKKKKIQQQDTEKYTHCCQQCQHEQKVKCNSCGGFIIDQKITIDEPDNNLNDEKSSNNNNDSDNDNDNNNDNDNDNGNANGNNDNENGIDIVIDDNNNNQ